MHVQCWYVGLSETDTNAVYPPISELDKCCTVELSRKRNFNSNNLKFIVLDAQYIRPLPMWLQQEKYMVTKLFVCALKKRGWDMWMRLFSRRSEQALNSASEPVNSPCTVLWFTLLQPVARGYRVRWKVFFFSLYARCWRRSDDCITGISSCVFIPAADSNCGLFTRGQLIFGTDIHLPWKWNSLNNQCWKYNILKYCSSSPPHIFDTCTYFADSDDSVFIGYQLLSDIVKVAWLK